MTDYFFLGTRLPPLAIGAVPDITFAEFKDLLRDNLTPSDYHQTRVIRRFYDIQNVRALWKEEPFDPYGNFDENELEEALVVQEGLPAYVNVFFDAAYVNSFLHEYPHIEERLEHFSLLSAAYFRYEAEEAHGFLKWYLEFERKWRLVLTALRAKQLQRDLLVELQYEDPEDPFILQLVRQKDSKAYDVPEGYENLRLLFEEYRDKPLEFHQKLCEYRFNAIEEKVGFSPFSLARVLGYMVQLIMVEKWLELDQEKGRIIVEKIRSKR